MFEFQCPNCGACFDVEWLTRYIWCMRCGQPVSIGGQVPERPPVREVAGRRDPPFEPQTRP